MAHRVLDYARRSIPASSPRGDFYALAGAELLSSLAGAGLLGLAIYGNGDEALAAIGAGAFLMLIHVAFCVLPTTLFLCLSARDLSAGKKDVLIVLLIAGLLLPAAAILVALLRPGGLPAPY